MAQALFRAIDRTHWIPRSQILFCQRDPKKSKEHQETFGITATTLPHLAEASDLLFLSVRPSDLNLALHDLQKAPRPRQAVISIVAGASIHLLQKLLGLIPLIRAMPNLSVEVGEGVTSLAYSPECSSDLKSGVRLLFQGMGKVFELEENQFDCATALAGSGPAYLFALIEAMARFGEEEGIPYPIARKMAAQTLIGAGHSILSSGDPIPDLIHRIAVPNGTTEAGLAVFLKNEVGKRFRETLRAASLRAKELSASSP